MCVTACELLVVQKRTVVGGGIVNCHEKTMENEFDSLNQKLVASESQWASGAQKM